MLYKAILVDKGSEEGICPLVTVHKDENDPIGKKLKHINIHSPGGFSWGYQGSGPSDLSIAILAHHFGERERQVQAYYNRKLAAYKGKGSIALEYHQEFKRLTVANWDREQGGSITSEKIAGIMYELMAARADERLEAMQRKGKVFSPAATLEV